MSRALGDALERLLAAHGTAAATDFTITQRCALDTFARQTGALKLVVQGRGASYQVGDHALVQAHLTQLRPVTHSALHPGVPARAGNIARMRDSKSRAHRHAGGYLLLKALGDGVLWERDDGVRMDLSGATQAHGVAAIAFAAQDGWYTRQPLWLVENQALFDRLDWLPAGTHGSVLYYGGQLSNVLLAWLAHRARASACSFFPDYDGVGLLNYSRLAARSQAPVAFWLMPGWRELLGKYGNNALWQKTGAQFHTAFARLRHAGMAPELDALCQAMAEQGLALEHEAVWLAV
jgi:hypothetical protein